MELAEIEWLLKVDIDASLDQLASVLSDVSNCLTVRSPRQYYLHHIGPNQLDTIKVNLSLDGFKITNADINIKLSSKHPIQTIKTCIRETASNPFCWRLYQIQDAINHVSNAIDLIKGRKCEFVSPEEVLQLVKHVMNSIQKSRTSLLIPRKRAIEELQQSQNMQSIKPALPLDLSISFYILSQNLVCSVYNLMQTNNGPQIKFEYHADVPLPHLSQVIINLGLGLQICQQIVDKLQLFPATRILL